MSDNSIFAQMLSMLQCSQSLLPVAFTKPV